MNHSALSRVLMLDHVADERFREHQRRSTSAAAIIGLPKIALMRWYQFKN